MILSSSFPSDSVADAGTGTHTISIPSDLYSTVAPDCTVLFFVLVVALIIDIISLLSKIEFTKK